MIWDDTGFLLSKNRYSENSVIADVFTENHGKISGIIFGGTSKKIKNYLQIGNKIYVNYNSKSVTRIGYFKIEILKALTPLYFDHNRKLSCIDSAMNLIKLLTAESQANNEIFDLIDDFSIRALMPKFCFLFITSMPFNTNNLFRPFKGTTSHTVPRATISK